MTIPRMPVYYLAHGGGPWPWMTGPHHDAHAQLAKSLRDLPAQIGATPKAVLMVSAHWEAPQFTASSHPRPPMLYDYSGFPPNTYEVRYPAPGDPALAARVQALLSSGVDDRWRSPSHHRQRPELPQPAPAAARRLRGIGRL